MKLQTELYTIQNQAWPQSGRHIMAQYDAEHIVVYQAYNSAIAQYAVEHQRFGGEFSFSRMSWIKPNFLWMMYRSNWGTSPNQEAVLAITLKRSGFEQLLSQAVLTAFDASVHASHAEWKNALKNSDIRLQWDPDHSLKGDPQERRAIQIGMKGNALRNYSEQWITRVEDISPFVTEQRELLAAGRINEIETPVERVYLQ